MNPTALFPPVTPDTLHITDVSVEFATTAENATVLPNRTEAMDGATETEIWLVVGPEVGCVPTNAAPEQPASDAHSATEASVGSAERARSESGEVTLLAVQCVCQEHQSHAVFDAFLSLDLPHHVMDVTRTDLSS